MLVIQCLIRVGSAVMLYLWGVTLLWAFSFSLIGEYLSGQVDNYFAIMSRVALACLVFLPLLLRHPIRAGLAGKLMAIGAVQLGCMYLFYYHSFLLLSVPEVLIFTIFTPVYVTLIYDLISGRFHGAYLLTAVIAIIGAAIIRYSELGGDYWLGFVVVQASNSCMAAGQVLYKLLIEKETQQQGHSSRETTLNHYRHFGWFYVGAAMVTIPAWLLLGGDSYPSQPHQWLIILWLGVVASGLGYFCWNLGATKVDSGTLSVMNNLLIPCGLAVNLVLWNQDTDMLRLLAGSFLLLLALWVNQLVSSRYRSWGKASAV